MDLLVFSILTRGLLTPISVRPIENGKYEVISGHRRLHACKKVGIETVPALIYTLDRDAATIAMVDSNLHREKILPSEKAFAYKMKIEAMGHRGKTCGQVGHKSRDMFSDVDSGRQVQRYIRLTELIPEILRMVDDGKNRADSCRGTFLSEKAGTTGSLGNHGERGLYSFPVPGNSDEEAEPAWFPGHE